MEHPQTHPASASPSTGSSPSAGSSRNTKLDHIIQNFYTKTAQVIVQARLSSESDKYGTSVSGKEGRSGRDGSARKINKWFNIASEDMEFLREDLRFWRSLAIHAVDKEPPPMRIDIYLDTSGLTENQTLVVADDNLRWNRVDLGFNQGDLSNSIRRILIETWVLTLQHPLPNFPVDLPNLYKRSIVFFRALHSLVRLLPSYNLARRQVNSRTHNRLPVGVRLASEMVVKDDEVDLETSILDGDARHPTKHYEFSDVVTPLGTLKLQVQYRRNCDFKIEESERDLSARFIEMDEHYFTPTITKYQQEKSPPSRSRPRPISMYDGLEAGKPLEALAAIQAVPSTSSPTSASRRLSSDSSSPREIVQQQQRRQSIIASRGSPFIRDYTSMEGLTERGLRRASAPYVSPFKSPSLSSSPQADAFLSNSKISPATIERPKTAGPDSGSSSRKVEFSSSFEKYKDRTSPSRIDTGSVSMMRRWSHASDHSSINAPSETEDADLEDFMRFVGSKRELKIFQGRKTSQLEESANISPPSEAGSSMNASAFGSSGSIYRSKRALSHFQNLRDTHASLSESLASSMIAGQERSEPLPLAGVSPGSSSSSAGRSYQPFVPSPLHAEQHSVSMPIPRHIPMSHDVSHATHEQHRRQRSSQQEEHAREGLSPETLAFSSYPQDVTDLRRLRNMRGSFTARRRRGSSDSGSPTPQEDRRRHEMESSLQEGGVGSSSTTAAGAESSMSREGGRTSMMDDDDSLVFKMSELGCEGSPQPVPSETHVAESAASAMVINRPAYKYSGYLKEGAVSKTSGLRRANSSGHLSQSKSQDELTEQPASPSKSEPSAKDQDLFFDDDT